MVATARELRLRQTTAEQVLWVALRNRKLDGLKFRRQRPVGPFVVDFYCLERMLVIEIDGSIHDLTADQDAYRTLLLTSNGHLVIRFRNEEVFENLERVLRAILAAAESHR